MIWSAILALVGSPARAQEPPASPDPQSGEVSEEVTVWGEAVEQAREAVVSQVENLGYDRVRDKGDRTVFKSDVAYRGKVVLYDDGRLSTRRTGVRGKNVTPIPGTRIRPYFLCLIDPLYCVEGGSWYVAAAKWRQTEDEVATATAAPLQVLGDRMADQAISTKLATLPDALEALWSAGTALDPSAPAVATYQDRRAAILAYWDSRTETEWGERVRDLVGAFVRAVVQAGDHPFTADERAAFEAGRRSSEPFPWIEADEER